MLDDSVHGTILVKVMVTLRRVGNISKTASSTLGDAIMEFLAHRIVGMVFRSHSLPIGLGARLGLGPVLQQCDNLAVQSAVLDGLRRWLFLGLSTDGNLYLFVDILGRSNSRRVVEGTNMTTMRITLGSVALRGLWDAVVRIGSFAGMV
jgi:hypothetical protein